MELVKNGKHFNDKAEGIETVFEGPLSEINLFDIQGRVYKTKNNSVFMIAYIPGHEDLEDFYSADESVIIKFMEDAGADMDTFKLSGLNIMEA